MTQTDMTQKKKKKIETYQQLRGGFLQEHRRSEVAKDPLCFIFKWAGETSPRFSKGEVEMVMFFLLGSASLDNHLCDI